MKSKVILFCVLLFCSKIVESIPFPEELVRHEAYQPNNWPVNRNPSGQYHNNGFSRTQNSNAQINPAFQNENTPEYYANQGPNYHRLEYNSNPSDLPPGPIKESLVNYDSLANGYAQIPQEENYQPKMNTYPHRPDGSQINFANPQYKNQNWLSPNQYINSAPNGAVIAEREMPPVTALPYRGSVQYPPFSYMSSPNRQYYQAERAYPIRQQYQYPMVDNSSNGRYLANVASPSSIPLESFSEGNPAGATRSAASNRYIEVSVPYTESIPLLIPVPQAETSGNLRKIKNYGSNSGLSYPQRVNNLNDGVSMETDNSAKKGDGGSVDGYASGLGSNNNAPINNNENDGFAAISDILVDNIGNHEYEDFGNNGPVHEHKKDSTDNPEDLLDVENFGNVDIYGSSSGTGHNAVIKKSSTDILSDIENSENVYNRGQITRNGKFASANKNKNEVPITTDTLTETEDLGYVENYGQFAGPANIASVNNYNRVSKLSSDTLKKINNHEIFDENRPMTRKNNNGPVMITNIVPEIENIKNLDSYKHTSRTSKNAPVRKHNKSATVITETLPKIGNHGNIENNGAFFDTRNKAPGNKKGSSVINEKFGNHENVDYYRSSFEPKHLTPVNYYKDFPAVQIGILAKSENDHLGNYKSDSSIVQSAPAVVTDTLKGNFENSKHADDLGPKKVPNTSKNHDFSVLADVLDEKSRNHEYLNNKRTHNQPRPRNLVPVHKYNETPAAPTDLYVENTGDTKSDYKKPNNPSALDSSNTEKNVYHEIFAGGQRYNFKDVVTHPKIKNLISKSTKRFVVVHPNGTVNYLDDLPIDQNPENYVFVQPNGVFTDRPKYDAKPASNIPNKDDITSKSDNGQISLTNLNVPVNESDNMNSTPESLVPDNYYDISSSTTTSASVPDIDKNLSSTQNTSQSILETSNSSSTVLYNSYPENDTKDFIITISPLELGTDNASDVPQATSENPVQEMKTMEIVTSNKPVFTGEMESVAKKNNTVEIVIFEKPIPIAKPIISEDIVEIKKQLNDHHDKIQGDKTPDTEIRDSDEMHKYTTSTAAPKMLNTQHEDMGDDTTNIKQNNEQHDAPNDTTTPDTNTTILDKKQGDKTPDTEISDSDDMHRYSTSTSAPKMLNTQHADMGDDTVNIQQNNEHQDIPNDIKTPDINTSILDKEQKYSSTTSAPSNSNTQIDDIISNGDVNNKKRTKYNSKKGNMQNGPIASVNKTRRRRRRKPVHKVQKYSTTSTTEASTTSNTPVDDKSNLNENNKNSTPSNHDEEEVLHDTTTFTTDVHDSDRVQKYSTDTTASGSSSTPINDFSEDDNDSDKVHNYSTTTTEPSSSVTQSNALHEDANGLNNVHEDSTTTTAPGSSSTQINKLNEHASDSDEVHEYSTTAPDNQIETLSDDAEKTKNPILDQTDTGKNDEKSSTDHTDASTSAPKEKLDGQHDTTSSSVQNHQNTDDLSSTPGPFKTVDTISLDTTSDNKADTLTTIIEAVEPSSALADTIKNTTESFNDDTKNKSTTKTVSKDDSMCKTESSKDDLQGKNLQIDLTNIKETPTVWFTTTHQDIVDKMTSSNEDCSVIYLFQMEPQPTVEREKQTTIYPNGTVIIETTETIWENKDDAKPKVVRTTKVVHLEDLKQA